MFHFGGWERVEEDMVMVVVYATAVEIISQTIVTNDDDLGGGPKVGPRFPMHSADRSKTSLLRTQELLFLFNPCR